MIARATVSLFLALSLGSPAYAAGHLHPERWYQERWCALAGGRMEVVLPDQTRCDCLTAANAVEVDFADKWAEAVGQAAHYGVQTGKRPGVVIIVEQARDECYVWRIQELRRVYGLPLDIWVVRPDGD